MDASDVSLQDHDQCGGLLECPTDRHEVFDTAFSHDLTYRWRRSDKDQSALEFSKAPEGLDKNTQTKAVDSGESLEIYHHRSRFPAKMVEGLSEGGRRVGTELSSDGNHRRTGRVTHLDVQIHRGHIVLSPLQRVADGGLCTLNGVGVLVG
jgi:hypothetical protein